MKIIKLTATALLCLVFMVFSGETAYYSLSDKASQDFDFLFFNKVYDPQELVDDVYRLLLKYDCSGFFVTYDEGDKCTDTYCCTDGDIEKIQDKLGLDSCSFSTIVSGSFEIKFSEIRSTDFSGRILDGLYIDGNSDDVNSVYNELCKKYECQRWGKSDYFNTNVLAASVFAVLILLLSVYDALNKKRDVCISLTLGNSLVKAVVKNQLADSALIAFAGLSIYAVMKNITAAVLVKREYALFVLALCVADTLGLCILFKADICSALKYSNRSSAFLPINYVLKFLSASGLIAVVCFSLSLKDSIIKYKETEKFKNYFSDYSQIELSESSAWASKIDSFYSNENQQSEYSSVGEMIEKELYDYNQFFRLVENESDVFLLNAFRYFDLQIKPEDVTSFNVVLSSDSAKEYIEMQIGTKLSSDEITFLLPEKYDEKDLYICKSWFKNEICKGGSKQPNIINYSKSEIAAFHYVDTSDVINNEYNFTILKSPIVIYVPSAEKYDYFGEQIIQTNISKDRISKILSENNIFTTRADVCTLAARANSYKSQKLSSLIIALLSFACVLSYWIIITASTIMLDIHIYRKERSIKKILGWSFIRRYIKTICIMSAVTVLSAVLVNGLAEYISFQNVYVIITASAVMILTELIVLLILGINDERKNTIKSLKGGAL